MMHLPSHQGHWHPDIQQFVTHSLARNAAGKIFHHAKKTHGIQHVYAVCLVMLGGYLIQHDSIIFNIS